MGSLTGVVTNRLLARLQEWHHFRQALAAKLRHWSIEPSPLTPLPSRGSGTTFVSQTPNPSGSFSVDANARTATAREYSDLRRRYWRIYFTWIVLFVSTVVLGSSLAHAPSPGVAAALGICSGLDSASFLAVWAIMVATVYQLWNFGVARAAATLSLGPDSTGGPPIAASTAGWTWEGP